MAAMDPHVYIGRCEPLLFYVNSAQTPKIEYVSNTEPIQIMNAQCEVRLLSGCKNRKRNLASYGLAFQ